MKKEVLGKFITIIACLCLFVAAFAVIFYKIITMYSQSRSLFAVQLLLILVS